jgi:iron complex outermembrane receptor protein
MRLAYIIVFSFIYIISGSGQNTFKVIVLDKETRAPLPGATAIIQGTTIGGSANASGLIEIPQVPNGNQTIEFSFLGYEQHVAVFYLPQPSEEIPQIFLEASEEELEEIVISSTRSTRTIADIPTRVEFISGEELDEKANMKPGDIRMLLSESTGIQTQQTSPTSANASIRIQGLDGRYTQILKDGFPLYSGFAGGLGLLQTPPLDLKQVEVIKGSTSTLYGGGAIAGLVNLISRVPSEERDLRFLFNGTTAKGIDLSGFYSQKFGKTGLSVFGSRNSGAPYDPADIDLTAIPKFERYSLNPRFFIDFSENTTANVSVNFTTEDRIGGDIHYIEGDGDAVHSYYENNESERYSTQFSITHNLSENSSISFKNSFNHFDRLIEVPSYKFEGTQNSTFTELNYITSNDKTEWVAGLNLWTDDFSETQFSNTLLRDYNQTTFGAFIQNNLTLNSKFNLESGLRGDYVVDYGFALLPRISLLYKASPKFSSRIGGGFGYKTPTIFTEESERIQFQNVLPISSDRNQLEKSYGANWDLNYRTELAGVGFSINHLFFYTYMNHPLSLETLNNGNYELINLPGHIDTKGMETNVKIEFGDFKLFLGYTFTDTKIHNEGVTVQNPLTAKHRMNNVLMYEVDEKWKVGLEAYYFSKQRLTDSSYGKDYWICGFMVEKLWEKFSVFINFENFLDARQTRFDTIYSGTITNPVFKEIYAPLDGFVVNGGLKLAL